MQKSKIQIMGILNTTPDSFSDGGLYYEQTEAAVAHAKQMVTEGATIVDIGGESTRPGSQKIEAKEELKRVIPVIKAIKKALPKIILSIDTYKAEVATEAIKYGCTIVNSLGGFSFDKNLVNIINQSDCKIIIYHIKGIPTTMQKGQIKYTDVIKEITQFFEDQLLFGDKHKLRKDKFILDPGVGFGKTMEQNVEIIKRFAEFKKLDLPLTIGVSRKSHLGMILKNQLNIETTPTQRLEGSLAETAIAIQNGATIIRTHDVLATKKFITVLENFL